MPQLQCLAADAFEHVDAGAQLALAGDGQDLLACPVDHVLDVGAGLQRAGCEHDMMGATVLRAAVPFDPAVAVEPVEQSHQGRRLDLQRGGEHRLGQGLVGTIEHDQRLPARGRQAQRLEAAVDDLSPQRRQVLDQVTEMLLRTDGWHGTEGLYPLQANS